MNTLALSLQEILSASPARLLHAGSKLFDAGQKGMFSEMCFDSRKVSKDSIFLCIKGERSDAHDFVPDAIKLGAKLVVGNNAARLEAFSESHAAQFLIVADPLVWLQQVATFYRRKFQIPVVGLTGSSGKTTTKDLCVGILAQSGPALVTEGTLNNHWGVPQMVMRLRPEHRAAVFEMGMSDFGEIASLSTICQPDIGYITAIGSAHLEKMKSERGVLKAKRELFDWIVEHGRDRALLFNIDDPLLTALHRELLSSRQKNIRFMTLSQKDASADVRLTKKNTLGLEHRYGWEYEFATPWGGIKGTLPLPGAHNLANAMAAATVCLATGVAKTSDVEKGLAEPQISKLRSNLFRAKSGAVIYDDSYNANPTSVTALFEAAKNIRSSPGSGLSKTVAVVGDMLELGPTSDDLHRKMGRKAAQDGVDVLLATGKFAQDWVKGYQEAKDGSGDARDFKSQDELFEALAEELDASPNETLVLIKGSRGAKMDKIAERL